MTTYRVVVEPEALEDIADAYQWIADHSPAAAIRWFNGLTQARDSLRQYPARCAIVATRSGSGSEIRQLLYGRRRNRYRILFAIRGDTVHILRVLHGARDPAKPALERPTVPPVDCRTHPASDRRTPWTTAAICP